MPFTMLAALFITAACDASQHEVSEKRQDSDFVQWRLPGQLREISGLAMTADQRLLAVNDEEAIVYEYDYAEGRLVKAFALGEPTLRDDFEGIAVLDDMIWLMSSNGDLYSAKEGADGERVAYEKHKFMFKDDCELEGLAADGVRKSLLLVCKDAKKKRDRLVFEWSTGGQSRKFRLPEAAIAEKLGEKRVHPSGIELDPATGLLVIVAARENAVFSISRDGTFVDILMRLDRRRHRQAEGIAISNSGLTFIADEGDGGSATLSVYRSSSDGREKRE